MLANHDNSQSSMEEHHARVGSTARRFLGSSTSPKAQELRARYEQLCMKIQNAKAEAPVQQVQP